jgi:hypothetical protein
MRWPSGARALAPQLGLALSVALGTACVGQIGGDGGEGSGTRRAESPLCTDVATPGAAPLRRLTVRELNNTLRDLLADHSEPASSLPADFPADKASNGFENDVSEQAVTVAHVDALVAMNEEVALRATQNLPTLVPCDPSEGDACARKFIESFGRRAYRRPLTVDEVDELAGVFVVGREDGDFRAGITLVIERVLSSPFFLYRVETEGTPSDGAVLLSSHEMASRLSYFLWESMPDDELFAAADAGALVTPEQIEAQARRMLADSKAREARWSFYRQWLQLYRLLDVEKSAEDYPTFSPDLLPHMEAEARAFVEAIDREGSVDDLVSAPFTYLSPELAAFYGMPAPASVEERVDLDPARHAGILTKAGLLSVLAKFDTEAVVRRGKWTRFQLLCEFFEPPANAVMDPAVDRTQAPCNTCHARLDPVGQSFEHYDGVGLWRDTHDGEPIDDSVMLVGTDVDGNYTGVRGLADKLTQSEQYKRCVVTQHFRYASGRREMGDDACSTDTAFLHFKKNGFELEELIVAITTTDSFRFRPAGEGGGE